MTQTISVFSTKLNKKTKVITDATSWGELKEELVAKGVYNSGTMKAIDRDSRQSLELSSASVYDGMTIFLLPTKNDSGADIGEEAFDEFVEKLNELIEEFRESMEEAAEDVRDNSDIEELRDEANSLANELRG